MLNAVPSGPTLTPEPQSTVTVLLHIMELSKKYRLCLGI